ncbi:MAG: hypothetical protein FWG67_05430 [Defluviitaleaceae bacterium]|nr:hypothetical protein [Defluviitaleaceae bacterium]
MKRRQEMVNHITELMNETTEKRKQRWHELDYEPIKSQLQKFLGYLEDPTHNIVISYLKSSYVTNSHHFKIAIYAKAPFVELYPCCEYIDMKLLFSGVEADIELFVKELRRKFAHFLKSEQEEIRRYYMELLYVESELVFKLILAQIYKNEKMPSILFGAELSEVKPIEMEVLLI